MQLWGCFLQRGSCIAEVYQTLMMDCLAFVFSRSAALTWHNKYSNSCAVPVRITTYANSIDRAETSWHKWDKLAWVRHVNFVTRKSSHSTPSPNARECGSEVRYIAASKINKRESSNAAREMATATDAWGTKRQQQQHKQTHTTCWPHRASPGLPWDPSPPLAQSN